MKGRMRSIGKNKSTNILDILVLIDTKGKKQASKAFKKSD